MARIEVLIFASPAPVGREALARLVRKDCQIERLIADIHAELRGRPFELIAVAGGWAAPDPENLCRRGDL